MANPDPSKTEKPTAKRLGESRDKGDIAVSQDITSVSSLMTATIMMIFLTPQFKEAFTQVFIFSFSLNQINNWTAENLQFGIIEGVSFFMKSFFFVIFGITIASLISIRVQVGPFFNTKPLEWKFDSLNPASGFKQLLPDKQKIFKFGLTMAKVLVISGICYYIIKGDMPEVMTIAEVSAYNGTLIMLKLTIKLCLWVLSIFIILSIIDILWKRKMHEEKLMMTKDEVKDEQKNAEGDPKVKAKIRAKMREMAVKNIMSNVKGADAVITNPTHVAVAISYQPGMPAPKVVAKGLRKKALRIKQIAKDNNIPCIEAPPLARSLYRSTEDGAFIDEKFFSAVAIILAKIFKRKKKKINS